MSGKVASEPSDIVFKLFNRRKAMLRDGLERKLQIHNTRSPRPVNQQLGFSAFLRRDEVKNPNGCCLLAFYRQVEAEPEICLNTKAARSRLSLVTVSRILRSEVEKFPLPL